MKRLLVFAAVFVLSASTQILGQLIDRNKAPNSSNDGISRPLTGSPYPSVAGDGRWGTDPNASHNVIAFDPFRAIRRGRQLFQRKFTRLEGQGMVAGDGFGNIDVDPSDRRRPRRQLRRLPRTSARIGGFRRRRRHPSGQPRRAAPLRPRPAGDARRRDHHASCARSARAAVNQASRTGSAIVTLPLVSKGISYGSIRALPDGTRRHLGVEGVDPDLRVRPFFAQGGTISIREFVVGAFNAEMGLAMALDPDLVAASVGADVTTPSRHGAERSARQDRSRRRPIDHEDDDRRRRRSESREHRRLRGVLPAQLLQGGDAGEHNGPASATAAQVFDGDRLRNLPHAEAVASSAIAAVADVETVVRSRRRATSTGCSRRRRLLLATSETVGQAGVAEDPRHSSSFAVRTSSPTSSATTSARTSTSATTTARCGPLFMTEPLWGVGTTPPYGHDGRSISLTDVILRHGGEGRDARDAFAALPSRSRRRGDRVPALARSFSRRTTRRRI